MDTLGAWACRTISNLASDAVSSDAIAGIQMIPTIARLLRSQLHNHEVLIFEACRALRRLAYQNEGNKGLIATEGCIVLVVKALEIYGKGSLHISGEGCELLASLAYNNGENRHLIAKTKCVPTIESILAQFGGASKPFREHAVWLLKTVQLEVSQQAKGELAQASESLATAFEFETKMENLALEKAVPGMLTATQDAIRFEKSSAFGNLSTGSQTAVSSDLMEIEWKHVLEIKAVGGGLGVGLAKPFKLRVSVSERAQINTSQL